MDLSLKSQAADHQEIKKEDLENQDDFTDDDIDDDLDEEDCDNDSIGTSTAGPGATTVLNYNFQDLNIRFYIQTYVQLLGHLIIIMDTIFSQTVVAEKMSYIPYARHHNPLLIINRGF